MCFPGSSITPVSKILVQAIIDSNFLTIHCYEKLIPTSEAWQKATTLSYFAFVSHPWNFSVPSTWTRLPLSGEVIEPIRGVSLAIQDRPGTRPPNRSRRGPSQLSPGFYTKFRQTFRGTGKFGIAPGVARRQSSLQVGRFTPGTSLAFPHLFETNSTFWPNLAAAESYFNIYLPYPDHFPLGKSGSLTTGSAQREHKLHNTTKPHPLSTTSFSRQTNTYHSPS